MGRQVESLVHQHFIYSKDKNRSKCKYCVKDYTGKIISNLRKHLESDHPDVLKIVVDAEEAAKKRKLFPQPETEPKKSRITQSGTLDKYVTKSRINIDMTLEKATEACLELVTKNGRPFKAIDDTGFQKLVRPIFDAFGTTMNRQKVARTVKTEAGKEMSRLSEILQSKLFCVKMDMATRLGRSFIGVNVQYPHEGKLQLSTLSVMEMEVNHTGENIKSALLNILNSFNLKLDNVYAATTDNGSNFVKCLKLCTDDGSNEAEEASDEDDGEQEFLETSDTDIGQDEWEDHDEIDSELETHLHNSDSVELESLSASIASLTEHPLRPMRCAAHTLQLAVQDFLKDKTINKLVITSRKLVKKLRTTNLRYVLKSAGKQPPLLDAETRWSSTFSMLQSLFNLKDTCKDLCEKKILTGTHLTDIAWNRIENLMKVLQPAKIATDLFQRETLTAGEFHEKWTKMKIALNAISSVQAKRFTKLIENREDILLSNPAVLASMYIDPRYKNMLTSVQTMEARSEIMNVAKRILGLGKIDLAIEQELEPPLSEIPVPNESANDDEDAYEKLLRDADKTKDTEVVQARRIGTVEAKLDALKEELMVYENLPRHTDRRIDIFYWWDKKSGLSQLLKDAALTVLSLPVTQVSVERLFSGLHYILSDLKGKMVTSTINNVMFLRMNRCFD